MSAPAAFLGAVIPAVGGADSTPYHARRAMAHIIAEPCIGTKDTACVEVCPVDCIHPTKDDSDHGEQKQLYIDPDTCIDCGLCVDECPVHAIFPQDDLPAEWQKYVQINMDYFAARNKA